MAAVAFVNDGRAVQQIWVLFPSSDMGLEYSKEFQWRRAGIPVTYGGIYSDVGREFQWRRTLHFSDVELELK